MSADAGQQCCHCVENVYPGDSPVSDKNSHEAAADKHCGILTPVLSFSIGWVSNAGTPKRALLAVLSRVSSVTFSHRRVVVGPSRAPPDEWDGCNPFHTNMDGRVPRLLQACKNIWAP